MTQPEPALDSFDDLLYRVTQVSEEEAEIILREYPDQELSQAVRQLLDEESEIGELLKTTYPERPERSGTESRRSSTATLPPGPLAVRRRLLRVGRTLGWVSGLMAFFFSLFHLFFGSDFRAPITILEHFAFWGISAASFGVFAMARSPRLGDRWFVPTSYAFVVVVCALAGLLHAGHEIHNYDRATPFGPYIVFIAFSPILLQAEMRSTLITAVASAVAALLGLVVAGEVAGQPADLAFTLDMLTGLAAGVGACFLVQRSLTVIRQEAAAGLRLGSYQLMSKLGEGGMGEVWRASHPLLARPAAVKLVRAVHLDGRPETREVILERFSREARTIAALKSNHTVRLFDFGVAEDGNVFLAMELLDGIDLKSLVERFGAQPVDRVLTILVQICDSLAEAHAKGLVHRDIKPANLMLCRQGTRAEQVKVLDFGSVGLAAGTALPHTELTATGAVVGTPAYLAPEVLDGSDGATTLTDIYGVGCVAHWLLVGRPVFDYASSMMQIAAHLRDVPRSISASGREVSVELESIVLQCLAKAPDQRPAGAVELAARLEAVEPAGDWSRDQAQDWWHQNLPPADESQESLGFEHRLRVEHRLRDSGGAAPRD